MIEVSHKLTSSLEFEFANAAMLCSRNLLLLWSLLICIWISMTMVCIKSVFHVCIDSFMTPHGLILTPYGPIKKRIKVNI